MCHRTQGQSATDEPHRRMETRHGAHHLCADLCIGLCSNDSLNPWCRCSPEEYNWCPPYESAEVLLGRIFKLYCHGLGNAVKLAGRHGTNLFKLSSEIDYRHSTLNCI